MDTKVVSSNPQQGSVCPFCGYLPSEDPYELLLHIETLHTEGQSPFVVSADPILCPRSGCGELVSEDEMAYHLDLHRPQDGETPEQRIEQTPEQHPPSSSSSSARRRSSGTTSSRAAPQRPQTRQGMAIQAWKALFEGHRPRPTSESRPRVRHKSKSHVNTERNSTLVASDEQDRDSTKSSSAPEPGEGSRHSRLGKSELGRFAHEQRMPDWLVTLLQEQGQVINNDIVPVLAQLLEQNPTTQCAYLCHPSVQHVSKLRREGGFCGYRNIQMLVSQIVRAQATGHERFSGTFPSIFQIQDLIENAWDMGFNAQGRVETGGIKGTRKYIGTPEAYAVFCSLGIPCSVAAFKEKESGKAKTLLLQAIELYFQSGVTDVEARIHQTDLPPVYLQHSGHSLTIVGFERQTDGRMNLLVFDPSFCDSGRMRRLVGTVFRHKPTAVGETLQPYRRGSSYLRRYNEFEILHIKKAATQ